MAADMGDERLNKGDFWCRGTEKKGVWIKPIKGKEAR